MAGHLTVEPSTFQVSIDEGQRLQSLNCTRRDTVAKTTPKSPDKQTEIRREVKKRQKQQAGKGKSTPEVQLPRAIKLKVKAALEVKARLRAEREAAITRKARVVQAAAEEAESRRIKEACENWITYWKFIATTYGLCKLEKFEKPQPEVQLAIDKLFNYGGHNDPRPGIQMLMGEEYYGMIKNGDYFITHNKMIAGDGVEEVSK